MSLPLKNELARCEFTSAARALATGRIAHAGSWRSVRPRACLSATYSINGEKYLNRDKGVRLARGRQVCRDQDVLALADSGRTDQITDTRVLETWFQGQRVFERSAGK
jgi:hypothetical protein